MSSEMEGKQQDSMRTKHNILSPVIDRQRLLYIMKMDDLSKQYPDILGEFSLKGSVEELAETYNLMKQRVDLHKSKMNKRVSYLKKFDSLLLLSGMNNITCNFDAILTPEVTKLVYLFEIRHCIQQIKLMSMRIEAKDIESLLEIPNENATLDEISKHYFEVYAKLLEMRAGTYLSFRTHVGFSLNMHNRWVHEYQKISMRRIFPEIFGLEKQECDPSNELSEERILQLRDIFVGMLDLDVFRIFKQ